MRLLPEYELERFYLQRRLELIDILQDLAEQQFYVDDPDEVMNPDDHKLMMLKKYYSDVLNPCDVEKKLKKIYPPEQYAPKKD
jgi:hypothetical protein